MIQTKNCKTCGKLFEKKINVSKKNWVTTTYCSNPCINVGRVSPFKGKTDRWSEDWKKRLSEHNLGFTSNTGRTHIKKGQRLSTGTEFKKGHKPWSTGKKLLYNAGPLNNNWKGGITSLVQQVRHSPEMKQWRKDVFERDNYTCTECGRKRKPGDRVLLEADHIKPFAKYPELRLSLSNGRTLCRECHLKMPTHGRNL